MATATVKIDTVEFERLFNLHYEELVRYAHTIVKNQSEAEDVIQQLFIKLWEKRNDLDVLGNPRAYLFRATYNSSLNAVKRLKRVNNDATVPEISGAFSDASDTVLGDELQDQIETAVSSLPEKCQEVFRLSRFEELSYKEISEQLNISVKTVENHMGKALRIMRDQLSDYLPAILITLLLMKGW